MALEEWKIRRTCQLVRELGKAYILLKHEETAADAAKEQLEGLGYGVVKEWDGRAWRLTVTGAGKDGEPLRIGDKVRVLSECGGVPLYVAVVTGFDPNPDYDRDCVGIYVDAQRGSIHPALIEKITEARDA